MYLRGIRNSGHETTQNTVVLEELLFGGTFFLVFDHFLVACAALIVSVCLK